MRSKQAKVFGLILATAITSTFTALPYTTKAMTEKNGVIYVTNKDVKNGKVVISNKTAKSIVIKKSAGKAIIKLKGVKLSGELKIEKGDYILKTSRTKIKSLKISGKDTNIKFDKSSDLNKKSFVLKIAKNTTGSIDLSEFGKKVTAELGKNSDINMKLGNNDKATVVVKKASISSKLGLIGKDESSSISKIRVESPLTLTVKVNTSTLETTKNAAKADITLENKVSEIKNNAGSVIADKEADRQKEEKIKEEKEKAEREKADKDREEKARQEKANEEKNKQSSGNGGAIGGGSYTPGTPGVPEIKATDITLTAEDNKDIDTDGGTATIKITYTPANATNKQIEWSIIEGSDKVNFINTDNNKAVVQALGDGDYKVQAKVKGSTIVKEISGTVSKQASKALENRIKVYLTYTVNKLNKDNYEDVPNMSEKLTKEIEKKVSAGGSDKVKWESYKTKVEAKITELAERIKELKDAENTALQAIETAYNNISAGNNFEPSTAKEAVETIEEKRKDISEKAFNKKITDKTRYNEIKAEVEDYKKIVTGNNPVIGDDGVALFNALPVSAKYELVKTGASGNIKSKELNAGDSQINLLKQMRNGGVGKYTVRLFKDFKYLKDVEMGKSAEKEVKLLKNESLGAVTYTYNDTDFIKTGDGRAELVLNNGKPMLKWKPIDNATSYDVVAYISMPNGDKTLGAGMLKSTSAGDNYDNIENESEFEQFAVEDHISQKGNINNKRRMCAVGLTNTEMELDKLVPDMEYFKREKNNSRSAWQEVQKIGTAIDIYIIPRNLNSLYVSNMSNVLGDASSHASKSVFITGDKFTFKVFYEKFYGKQFPYEELD
ncbi:MAG: hypothetical protein ACTTKY_00800 [Catonella sp.]